MPLHIFNNRNRSGSYVVMLIVGAALFSMFYFLSLFVQQILDYSPVKAGVAFLPFTVGIVFGAGLASQLTPRLAPRILVGVGLVLAASGMFLFAQLTPTSSYVSDLLPPMVIMAVGMGLVFVTLTLTAVSGVVHNESGLASALLNTVQQVGGSLGLAVLATIAATVTTNAFAQADAVTAQAQAAAAGVPGVPPPDPSLLALLADAATEGYTTAFAVGGFMMLAALVITVVAINAPKQTVHEEQPAAHVG